MYFSDMQISIPYEPVKGKTYSLFGKENSTFGYYRRIRELTDQVLEKCNNPFVVLKTIQEFSKKKRTLRKLSLEKESESFISFILHLLNASLNDYSENVNTHLRNLSLYKFRDQGLRTIREQYHLYMLEIELTNRINIDKFHNSDNKIALLPHCLRDFDADCKSVLNCFGNQCKFCSKNCYQNYISRLLKINNIIAYIWDGKDIKKNAKKVITKNQTLSVLGIACIPELVSGMRKCQSNKIPVIGIPLDANRCIRWMGKFHKNSVNLGQLDLFFQK